LKDGRRLELGERGPGLGRRDSGLHGELADVLAGPLGGLLGDPGVDINGASLPAMTLHDNRRRRSRCADLCAESLE
jgi:hypothetical protein